MDESYELNGITFIWDSKKAQINSENHGVTFQQAAEAFFDPFLIIVDASPEEETRDAVIGMDMRWNLFFVVHILIEDEHVRIISVRKATRSEKVIYEN
ncbi:MAG: BrnT family toxin [Flavobacteriia bacterium]|nr:MAG: BrnT family toxin [Flavobacteriia bacterium]